MDASRYSPSVITVDGFLENMAKQRPDFFSPVNCGDDTCHIMSPSPSGAGFLIAINVVSMFFFFISFYNFLPEHWGHASRFNELYGEKSHHPVQKTQVRFVFPDSMGFSTYDFYIIKRYFRVL